MAFEQAAIKVVKEQEFATLQAALQDAFSPENVEKFLKQLDRKGIRIRDLDGILRKKVLEAVGVKVNAQPLYEALPVTDQAQMREFYLSKIEAVEIGLRHKYKTIYQYY